MSINIKKIIIAIILGLLAVFASEAQSDIAEITKVYDGDTYTGKVHTMWGISFKAKFRMSGIQCPEIRGKGLSKEDKLYAKAIRDTVRSLILKKYVRVYPEMDTKEMAKKGKWQRWLVVVVKDDTLNLNTWLLKNNYAVVPEYLKK